MENSEIRKAIAEIKNFLGSLSDSFKVTVKRDKAYIYWGIDYDNRAVYPKLDSITSAEIDYRRIYFKEYVTPSIIDIISIADKDSTIKSYKSEEAYDGILIKSQINYLYVSKPVKK